MDYLELLDRLHAALQPSVYLEIGVEDGDALALSRSRSVAIAPVSLHRDLSAHALEGKPWLKLYQQPSNVFFQTHTREATLMNQPLDLAFIDGLHEFVQVARDLENIERWAHARTVVIIHDVIPSDAWHASRRMHEGAWTGDVWRIVPFLREHRPDLACQLIDVAPTGVLVVTGLNPGRSGMADAADALDRAFPQDGPEYERLLDAYLSQLTVGLPERLLQDLPGQPIPITHQLESEGWLPTPSTKSNILQPVPGAVEHSLRIMLDVSPRFAFRFRLALIAKGMDVIRLRLRGVDRWDIPRVRNVFFDVTRSGALYHELERVALDIDPERGFFELELEGSLDPGETLLQVELAPADVKFADVTATEGMAIEVQQVQMEQIAWPKSGARFLPELFVDRSRPRKRKQGKRDAVVFAWFVPERMPELGEYYLGLLRYHHPDSKIFIGMNHGSDPAWEERFRESGLDVAVRWARPEIGDFWDATGFLTALEGFHHSDELFDLVWFGHTKGASGADHTDYHHNRIDLQRNFWARRTEIETFFADPRIGVFASRFSPWWEGICGDELPALNRIYRDSSAPVGYGAYFTFYVMRAEIVRRFCETVAGGFFSTAPGEYGANRWFFEMGFPNVAAMQGYEPYLDMTVEGENDPRDDVWIRHDVKQNHRIVKKEIERWRSNPHAFVPRRMRQFPDWWIR